jgi:hypothetical protein
MEPDPPRVLVEGGPVERRINRRIAILTGIAIGIAPVLGWTGVKALNVSSAIRQSRAQSCEKANERHLQAKGFVVQLVAKSAKKPRTAAGKQQQAEETALFLEAIAPKYDCRKF